MLVSEILYKKKKMVQTYLFSYVSSKVIEKHFWKQMSELSLLHSWEVAFKSFIEHL